MESEARRLRVLREVVFYCSYRFNGVTDKHSNTELVDRNDLVLAALRRIAQSGGFFLFISRVGGLRGEIAQGLLKANALGPIVLITPELGKWSTVGGLGVMVDNLSKALAKQGEEVIWMGPSERRRAILEHLCQKRFDTTKNLAELFGVCERTIRNDLS